ncbi:hypothetical protein M902_2734 [Bacteriovorax sp. BAL6_X]|uniref:hypothetical protein n=1 Tax=Bacteriovorax sp. BAL6_X TaxID=1201290 RepID=UPI0003865E42|nr:hypothetical protein [Bacteriovorax sp. BAL6_X]EPZ51481.1 hypothetical protein M902_2734 [Bacteriovorax sp. BAL6_X]
MSIEEDKTLYRNRPIGALSLNGVGEVNIYPLNFGLMFELCKKLKKKIKDCSPEEYVENLLLFVIFKKNESGDEEMVKEEDIANMSYEDKEKIINVLLKENEGLYRKNITDKKTDEDGNTSIEFKYGEIEYPKEDGESLFHYFHRLSVIEEEGIEESSRKITESFKSQLHFSSGLNNRITDMLKKLSPVANQMSHMQKMAQIYQPLSGLSESVARATKLNDTINKSVLNSPFYKILNDQSSFELRKENPQLIVPRDNRLDALKELKESFSLMTTKMDVFISVTTEMLNEMKDSGDLAKESSRHSQTSSKTNVRLTYLVIFITVLFGFATIYTTYESSSSSTDEMIPPLNEIVKSINNQNTASDDSSKKIIELLEKSLESDEKILKELHRYNKGRGEGKAKK